MLIFIALSHWSIMPLTFDRIPQPVLDLPRKSECQARSLTTLECRGLGSNRRPPVPRSGYSADWATEACYASDNSALIIYVLLHISKCLVCKLNSLWRLLNEKNVEKHNYLHISYVHDNRHFDFRSDCLLIMCSVYLNRGFTPYFIVFNKSRSHLSVTCLLQGNLCL